jgi:hypothetical protein
MKLVTDHAQWYDDIFDGAGLVFHRMAFTRGGLTKRQQLALLERMGYRTPAHGAAAELHARLTHGAHSSLSFPAVHDFVRAVVYHDELAHRGEGKEVMLLAEAAGRFPNCLATVFHPPAEPGLGFRFIRLADLGFWQRQQSTAGDWRSNHRDQERVLARQPMTLPNPIGRVLWAVDFVPAAEGLLAVDFNTAPDLTSLGESGLVTASEIRAELEAAGSRSTSSLEQF